MCSYSVNTPGDLRREKAVLDTYVSKQWLYCFVIGLVDLILWVCKPDYRFSLVSQSRKVIIVTSKLLIQLFSCGTIILNIDMDFISALH